MRIEIAEAVAVVPGTPTQVKLNNGRSLSVDAIVLVSGRPEGGMPEFPPRSALDYLLESLAGLASIGGSRVQQEVVLKTALAAMLQLGAAGQAARLLSRHRATTAPLVTRGAVN